MPETLAVLRSPVSVSIVVPTFNHLDLLKACLQSIAEYTDLQRCEVIVVANGCTDGTVEFLKTLPPSFRFLVYEKALGFPAAVNEGIRAARGKYILLLNNDTVILPQPRNHWVELLLAPFQQDRVGVTGPVKFSWDCGGVERRALAFWCAMIPRRLFAEFGFLDEIFSPGMGEDGDFCIKAELAGYQLVQVPVDGDAKFGTGIPNQTFPVFHKGSGTFGDGDYRSILARNKKILEERYGKPKSDNLETIYAQAKAHPCDVNELFPVLRAYAEKCSHVTEFGTRGVMTTWALMAARPKPLVSIVIPTCGKDWERVLKPCIEAVVKYTDMSDKEIIVVANGAPEAAISWLKALPTWATPCGRVVTDPERMGYIRAVNAGILASRGEFVVTFDDDCTLMPQTKDFWINALLEPFKKDEAVAASGPFSTVYKDEIGHVLHSGCTMYRRDVLEKLGGFDEAFNPGYMGDEDLSVRIRKAGYKLATVPPSGPREYANGMFVLEFPVVHMGTTNTMDKHGADLPLVKKNRDLLYRRHGTNLVGSNFIGSLTGMVPDLPQAEIDRLLLQQTGGATGTRPPMPRPKVSIIIPTYKNNFRIDEKTGEKINLLQRNLKTLAEHTDLVERNIEVIVVCNGCVDGQEEYVKRLDSPFRVISFPDPIGYTRATNEGIKVATGDYFIFLNDDVEMLSQAKNEWFDWLLEPFLSDPKTGVTGPLQLHDDYADEDVIIGFCLCVSRKAMNEVMKEQNGLLDEIYSPGAGEDIDLCCKMRRAGYKVRQVPREGKLGFSHTNVGEFMIWHVNNQTFKDIPEYTNWIVKRNGFVNMKRYNRNIKLNLGSGGIEYPGYLSVDLYDKRAAIIMDATKLDLPENSVTELLALHLFEHLSPYRAADVLAGWFKVLKPGGRLVMEMPDIEKLCERFAAAKTADYPRERYGILNAIYGSVNTTGEGEPSDITAPHLFGWWEQSLRDHLMNAGFIDIVFGPEQHPHPESNLRVEATKPVLVAVQAAPKSMMNLWRFPEQPVSYGDDTTYLKAAEFLRGCVTIEDWGCGAAYFKRFINGARYVGVDGSESKFCDRHVDLVDYCSDVEGILLRHVCEHNADWKRILENAVASFTKKLVIVIFTPFGSETQQIATNWSDIPDLSFRKEDLTECWKGLQYTEESFKTATQYGEEHVFYISR